ncbi:hypothetical protein E4U61_002074 [Claviceps capensis]|nr:hypothetical protein E4U61_002074 [Claviceps capensis]
MAYASRHSPNQSPLGDTPAEMSSVLYLPVSTVVKWLKSGQPQSQPTRTPSALMAEIYDFDSGTHAWRFDDWFNLTEVQCCQTAGDDEAVEVVRPKPPPLHPSAPSTP